MQWARSAHHLSTGHFRSAPQCSCARRRLLRRAARAQRPLGPGDDAKNMDPPPSAADAAASTNDAADDHDAERARRWDALTDVERTALGVAFLRAKGSRAVADPRSGAPLFEDPFADAAVERCVPPAARAEFGERFADARRLGWMAVRTAELDARVLEAAAAVAVAADGAADGVDTTGGATGSSGSGSSGVQVVVLGAGLDARCGWRLRWPPALAPVRVFEADSPAMLSLKQRALAGFALGCAERAAVACDLADADALAAALLGAGFDPAAPSVWLLEGLIGYLAADAQLRLMRTIRARLAAPGRSRAVVTAPPTAAERAEMEAAGMRLHHAVFEEAEATLARCVVVVAVVVKGGGAQ